MSNRGIRWIEVPVVCGQQTILPGLDPAAINDESLPDLCLRMHLILDSIEFERCEGRLLNLEIFDPIDTLADELTHHKHPHWSDWDKFVQQFGDYYELNSGRPIHVTERAVEATVGLARSLGVPLPSL